MSTVAARARVSRAGQAAVLWIAAFVVVCIVVGYAYAFVAGTGPAGGSPSEPRPCASCDGGSDRPGGHGPDHHPGASPGDAPDY